MKGTETMAKVVNVIGQGSNVGKTVLMEGLIKELRSRGLLLLRLNTMFMDLISIIQEKIHIVIVKRVLIRLLFHQKIVLR